MRAQAATPLKWALAALLVLACNLAGAFQGRVAGVSNGDTVTVLDC